MKLKDLVIQYRGENNMTQEEFSKACRVSKPTLVKIERGDIVSSLTMSKVAIFLGYNYSDLEK